jgi:hypothetical protein
VRLGRTIRVGGCALALAGTIACGSMAAQNGRLRGAIQQHRAAAAQRQAEKPPANGMVPEKGGPKGTPNGRGMEGLPPKWVENLRDLPPDEQDRFMQNDARFTNLPPQRQQQIRENLQKWNALSPLQQQAARNAAVALEHMSPEQRQYVRDTLLPKWQAMPPDRRQVINRHLAMLGQMSPDTQQAALNDPKFMQGLSTDEQDVLRNLNSLRNPPNE